MKNKSSKLPDGDMRKNYPDLPTAMTENIKDDLKSIDNQIKSDINMFRKQKSNRKH